MKSIDCVRTILLICISLGVAGQARAQLLMDELPENARGIDVEDRVGEFVPLDLVFTDERGQKIGLGKFFKKGKPVVLTLNYSDCPGLCIAHLDNLVSTLRKFNSKGLGDEFEIVTVSIDPNEKHDKAARTKMKYVGMLAHEGATESWHFLTGESSEIKALAKAVGFKYTYDRLNKRYNHPAATYFLSEDGRICRYLLSLGVEPEQFQLAVGEAKSGILTSSVADAIIQFCYYFDPDANRYSASARRILAFAGGAFCILLAGGTAPFWFSTRRTDDKKAVSGNAKMLEDAQASQEQASV